MHIALFLLYLVVAYIVVVPFSLLFLLFSKRTKRQIGKKTMVILFIIMLLLPLLPYARVIVLTEMYKPHFSRIITKWYSKDYMKVQKLRIISISSSYARVYVVVTRNKPKPKCPTGEVFYFERSNKWQIKQWDTVWSSCASADGNIFPPYLY